MSYVGEDETPMILCLMMKSEAGQEFPMHVVIQGVVRYPDSGGETVEHSLNGWHVPGDEVTDAFDMIGATVVGAISKDGGWVARADQDVAMIRDTMAEVLGPREVILSEVIAVRDDVVFVRTAEFNEIRAIKRTDLKAEVKVGDEIDLSTVENDPTNQLGL